MVRNHASSEYEKSSNVSHKRKGNKDTMVSQQTSMLTNLPNTEAKELKSSGSIQGHESVDSVEPGSRKPSAAQPNKFMSQSLDVKSSLLNQTDAEQSPDY